MIKNDNAFECVNCGKNVPPLKYTSRDHCPHCLHSIHVDNIPGDRANKCHGLLVPIDIETDPKKEYVIVYKCSKCGEIKKNKYAVDDNFNLMLEISRNRANNCKLRK